jgi:uncharacterized protein
MGARPQEFIRGGRGACVAALCLLLASAIGVSAQTPRQLQTPPAAATPPNPAAERLNENTVTIISGNPNGTYLQIAYDMAAVLDDGDNLRVLGVIGKGGMQNVRDVRMLKGIDLGLTQSNVLSYYRRTNEIGPIDGKIVYIARMFTEEMHIVVRSDITAIEQLRGKRVNLSDFGSGTYFSGRDVLERLGLQVEVVSMGQADAFEAMRRGDLAASVLVAGRPAGAIAGLKAADGFRILPVPYDKSLQADYLPSTLTSTDYPRLIAPDQRVDTIAVSTVLVAYNWPKGTDRYRRIEKFVDAFFSKIDGFRKAPRHPKWQEVNLAAVLPGWQRFPAAQEWLQRNAVPSVQGGGDQAVVARPAAGGQQQLGQDEQQRLFEDFLKWQRNQR